ncbi:GWxTD domain-containing protein, partial [candidate division KSB1 bacterium]
LRKYLKLFPSSAEAHNLLGHNLLKTKPVLYRLRAELEFKRAVENDPLNSEYLMDLGKYYLENNNPYKAEILFNKANNVIPKNPEILYYLALTSDRKGLSDISVELAETILQIDPENTKAKIFLDVINERRIIFTRAEKDLLFYEPKFLDEALKIDKNNIEIYYSLGYRYFINENFTSSIKTFKNLTEKAPDYDKAKIFLWLSYKAIGENERAIELFNQYREKLGEKYNFIWQITEMMLPKKDRKKYDSLPEEKRADFLKRFWKAKDPLFSSNVNEREIEHYKRIAIAIKDFSSDGIKWDRRGEIWIRFGKPSYVAREAIPPREIWHYDKLSLTLKFVKFGDRYELFDYDRIELNYSQVTGLGIRYHDYLEYLIETSSYGKYRKLAEETSEFFEFDYGGTAFSIPYYKADFKGETGKTVSRYFYGCPEYYFSTIDYDQLSFNTGFVLMDDNFYPVVKNIINDICIDSLESGILQKDSMIIFKNNTAVDPGDYYLSIELKENKTENIAIIRDNVTIREFSENEFEISDIIIAYDTQRNDTLNVLQNNDSNIYPHPRKEYNLNFPQLVLFEIYNLQRDKTEKTRFEINTIISDFLPEKKGFSKFLDKVAKIFGWNKRNILIENSYIYEGTDINEKINYSIDMKELNPGIYTLFIEVHDVYSGKKIKNHQNFVLY